MSMLGSSRIQSQAGFSGRPSLVVAKPSRSVQQLRPRHLVVFASEGGPSTSAPEVDEELMTETERRRAAAGKLRKAEKFLVVGSGSATCSNCSYEYKPETGDPDFPAPKGMRFEQLPADYFCPTCGAPKEKFRANVKEIAGFAENQTYGLGTNTMTGEQKSGLIYGALAFFFLCFIAGYALE